MNSDQFLNEWGATGKIRKTPFIFYRHSTAAWGYFPQSYTYGADAVRDWNNFLAKKFVEKLNDVKQPGGEG